MLEVWGRSYKIQSVAVSPRLQALVYDIFPSPKHWVTKSFLPRSTGLPHPSPKYWFTTSFHQVLVYDILPPSTGLRHPSTKYWFTTSYHQALVYDFLPPRTRLRHPSQRHCFTTSYHQALVYDILPASTGLRHPSPQHSLRHPSPNHRKVPESDALSLGLSCQKLLCFRHDCELRRLPVGPSFICFFLCVTCVMHQQLHNNNKYLKRPLSQELLVLCNFSNNICN